MPHRKLMERTLERQAEMYWSGVMRGWESEPPLQPDGYGKSGDKRQIEMNIPEPVVAKMDKICNGREDLRMIFYLGSWAAVLLAFTQSESKIAIAVPAGGVGGGVEAYDGRVVPVTFERPDKITRFKDLLAHVMETFRNNDKHLAYWLTRSDSWQLPTGYERFGFHYNHLQGREMKTAFGQTNEALMECRIVVNGEGGGSLVLVYDSGYYSRHLAGTLGASYLAVLEQAVDAPDRELISLELRSPAEAADQARWNDTAAEFAAEQTIHDMFALVATARRDAIAVVCGSETLSYGELNAKAENIALRLHERGVRQGDRVAVMLERSPAWIVSLLAVMKSGAVYVPVDPSYPEFRIDYMLKDSQASALILRDDNEASRDFNGIKIKYGEGLFQRREMENVFKKKERTSSEDLAYLLYTSGSTGEPKGVMVEHRGVLNLRHYFLSAYRLGEADRVLQFASASFDASIWEISMALLTGAQLHIATPDIVGEPTRFERWAADSGITVATLPPTYADKLVPGNLGQLRLLITAGSESNRELLASWGERVEYVNAYGPTETTVCASAWSGKPDDIGATGSIPVGRPLPNTQIRIVNRELQTLPSGIPGELAVSGIGLARGYWNREEMTERKFVKLPGDGTRAYRTGDLAKWGANGNLVFLGRIDRQVKIRGYRIETEEIRHVLTSLQGVKDAIVAVKPDPQEEPALVAYYVGDYAGEDEAAALRERLANRLPGYMVPAFLIRLATIPLTANGKPDVASLPAPGAWLANQLPSDEQRPQGECETRLAGLWRKVLGVERIGREDDFFLLGGHSMKAAKLAAEIYGAFGANMPIELIFRHSRLLDMARWIAEIGRLERTAVIPRAPAKDAYRLSPAQSRVYIAESSSIDSTLYVLPFLFRLEPAPDFAALEEAFRRLIERHEPLRTSFGWQGKEPVQLVAPKADFRISRIEGRGETPEQIAERLIEPFDLARAPLLRAAWIDEEDGSVRLFLQLHHIIADGLSLGLLLHDLNAIVSELPLAPLSLQYKDYCDWLHGKEVDEENERFWAGRFADYEGTADLPLDYPRPSVRRPEGDTLAIQWDRELTARIRKLSEDCQATVHMTMLAAYYALLSKLTGSEDGVVGSLHAGRNHPDVMGMVGMFVHTLAHRNRADGSLTFRQFAALVKSRVLEDYEHADYPFELLARKQQARSAARNPLFDTMFVLQNLDAAPATIGASHWLPVILKEKLTRFDLVFQAWENEEGMLLWVTYASSLFRPETAAAIAEDYRRLLAMLAERPDAPLGEIGLSVDYRPITASGLKFDFQF
ncbi:amino acid adenylation domain-containing protein [Cohnella cellulosilytica]